MSKRTKIIIAAAIILFGAYGYFVATKKEPLNYTSARTERGDVVQTVSATGTVEAAEKIDLNFLSAERIKEVNVKVGDAVKEGDVLARLDTAKLDAQLAQSQSALLAAQASLQTVLEGASDEEVKVAATAVENAEIALANAKQSLEDTKLSTDKEIKSAESSVDSASVSLRNAEASLENVKASNENSLDNAYGAAWDGMISALTDCGDALNANTEVKDNEDAQDTLGATNSQTVRDAEISEAAARSSYDAAVAFKNNAARNRTRDNVEEAIDKTQDALEKTRATLSDTYEVLQATITSSTFTQAALDALKTKIITERSGLNATIAALTTKEQGISSQKVANQANLTNAESAVNSAKSALAVSESNLASVKSAAAAKINNAQNAVLSGEGQLKQAQDSLAQVAAGASSSKILAAQAQAEQARASVELIETQLKDMVLIAPHEGVVTAVNGEVGEIASVTEPFISLIVPEGFEIKANISEVEIAKLKVGDSVEITFDALGADEKFTGEISKIDPAETEVSGVIYYQVTTLFVGDGDVVKPGMTANLDILTAEAKDVLKIPFQALKEKDGYKYVQIVAEGEIREVPVEIGLKGDSEYEIKSGLEEGQEVVTFLEKK
jgi:HlyD family secretion protein